MHTMKMPEREEKEKVTKSYICVKYHGWKVPESGEKKRYGHPDPWSPEDPKKLNLNRVKLRHSIIKLSVVKDNERILRASKEKRKVIYKGTPKEY